ncbi:MAG: VOC family protein [Chitinophagaceae bacterium]
MATINPYLNFNGTTEEAFNFYRSVFGGDFTALQRFKDIPDGDKMSESTQQKLMHISFPVLGTVLMATDALESMGQHLTMGNNFHLAIQAETEEEAKHLFNALAEGGTVTMPLDKAFWGAWFGMLTDKFGVHWMMNCEAPAN